MGLSLAKYMAKVSTIKVDLGDGDTLNIQYRPGVYTPEFEEQFSTASNDENANASDVLAKSTCDLVYAWDLLEDDTTPVTLTPERLKTIPTPILLCVFRAIGEDLLPKKKSPVSTGSFS